MSLRLARLPDRTPVKMVIAVEPSLASALTDYATVYAEIYGEEEKPETLVPAMLEAFLASDAGFRRARKTLVEKAGKGD